MKYWVLICSFLGLWAGKAIGQDYLLSQRFQIVHQVNPAKVGITDTDFRCGLAYRNQWAAISKAYSTGVAHYDMPVLKKRTGGPYLGVGAMVVSDKAGKSRLGTFEFAGTVAAHLPANDYNRLSTGLQVGISQRSINTEGLAWDSQFNGVGYDPTLPSGEVVQLEKRNFVDFALGMEWHHKKKQDYHLAYAVYHYGQNQAFLRSKDRKFLRHTFQAQYTFKISKTEWDIELISQLQKSTLENTLGVRMRQRMGMDSRYTDNMTSSAIHAGLYFRYGDALIPMLGYEFERMFTAWFSYDINVSRLHIASRYQGAWEIHIMYTGWLKKRRVKLH
ncbi:MAG: PorP/SprF family type IX secretion system membrane protein [Flavobacteriales bacterium]|nr:PorP/SprF family type IX secretion system membrane protein [Flavobacteriales bacterium]